MQNYNIEILQYGQNIKLPANCNGIAFTNTGTVNVAVNGYKLIPLQTLSINANFGENDVTQYIIVFDGGVGQLTVIKKHYI